MGVYFLQCDAANLTVFLLKETSRRHAISGGHCTEKLRRGRPWIHPATTLCRFCHLVSHGPFLLGLHAREWL